MEKTIAVRVLSRLVPLLALILLAGFLIACDGAPSEPTTPSGNVLTFSPLKLPEAVAGQPYQATITVTGNRTPVGYIGIEGGELPAGLEMLYKHPVENTAVISGTPQKAGTFKFTVNTWCMGTNNPGQAGRREYELIVK